MLSSTRTLGLSHGASRKTLVACSAMIACGLTSSALAAVWNVNGGGSWGTVGNWTPAAIPNAADAVADFSSVNPTADATATLDGDRIVGTLKFGDTDTATAAGWVLNGTSALPAGNFITFQTTSGPATLNVDALAAGKSAVINAKLKSTATQEVVKTGAGTVFLGYGVSGSSQDANFLGILTMQEGTVAFNNAFQLPVFAPDRMVFNGGTLSWTGAGYSSGRIFTLGAGGGRIDNNGTGQINLTGTAAMALNGSGSRTMTFGGTNTGTASVFASAIGDGTGGATSIAKVGATSWTLTNASSNFSGTITTSGSGTLTVPNLGSSASIGAGTTLGVARTTGLTYGGSVSGAGNFAMNVGNNQLNLTNANFTGTTTLLVGTYLNNNPSTSNFVIGATGQNITSYGVLGLTNADFTGPLGTSGGGISWITSGGFSAVNANTRIVNIGGNAVPDTLTLGLGGFYLGSNSTLDSRIKFGDVSAASLGIVDFKNNVILNGRAFKTVVDGTGGNVAAILSGDLTGTGRSDGNKDALVKFGNSSLKLTGNNTYSGATVVGGTQAIILGSAGALSPNTNVILSGGSAGTVSGVLGLGAGDLSFTLGTAAGQLSWLAGNSGGFAAYGANRSVTLNGGASLSWGSTASFVATGQNIVLSLPSADGTITIENPIDLNGAARTVVVNDGSASVDARFTQALSGNASSGLTKTGAGTLVLSAANTYGGTTSIGAGTLLVNGSVTGLSTVAALGTLGGTGTLGDSVTVDGKLSPGASAGSLEIAGNLSLNATSSFVVEIGGVDFTLNTAEDYDRVKLTGATPTITIAGALSVAIIDSFTLGANESFGIIQVADGATRVGTFASLPADGSLVGTYGGTDLFITYSGNVADGSVSRTGGNDVVLYTVPEPTTLLTLGGAAIVSLRRRRN